MEVEGTRSLSIHDEAGRVLVFQRAVQADVFPTAQRYNMGVLIWSPLTNGWLAGTVERGEDVTAYRANLATGEFDLSKPENQRKLDILDGLHELANGSASRCQNSHSRSSSRTPRSPAS